MLISSCNKCLEITFNFKKKNVIIQKVFLTTLDWSSFKPYRIMTKYFDNIPTYRGHWFWKSTFEILKNPIHFYVEKMAEFGDTFYAQFPLGKLLVTGNPNLIKHVLQTNNKNYPKDKGYEQLALLLGRGLVTSKNPLWRKQRKIAQPAFYKKSLIKLFDAMAIVTQRHLEELDTKRGQELDISREMMAVTAKIAMKALFSKDLEGDLKEIYDCISYSQQYVSGRFLNPFSIPFTHINGKHRKFNKHLAVMDELIYDLIQERKKDKSLRHDFLQMLLDARYEDTGEPMPRDLLRDELVTIFSAGHETSSNGLTWTLYLLSQHPEIVEKIRSEAKKVLRGGLPTFHDLKNLIYTRQVIEEGMRLFPPVWAVGRYAVQSDEWEGQVIAKDTPIAALIYLLHRNPGLWENPEAFDPERFAPEKVKARPNAHYMPFGAGPRMCIGNHFAMMEMQLLLPVLIQNFDFELVESQQIELEPLVTLRPKYGMKMKVK